MASFVLIHGAFHGGWCWEQIVPLLKAAGHTVVAPNLPGMAGDPTSHDQVTLKRMADFAADIVRAQATPVILAGHSLGGITISEVAERVPEHLAGLVYVAAMLVPNGKSVMDASTQEARDGASLSAGRVSASFDPAAANGYFYNRTDAALAQAATARLTPQPTAPLRTPLTLTEARFGRVPRAYIECAADNAIPLAMQRQMQAALPCDPVFTLATDHSPFLSQPQEFVDCLLAINAKFQAL